MDVSINDKVRFHRSGKKVVATMHRPNGMLKKAMTGKRVTTALFTTSTVGRVQEWKNEKGHPVSAGTRSMLERKLQDQQLKQHTAQWDTRRRS